MSSYLNCPERKAIRESIKAIAQVKMFDASSLSLEMCKEFLSTHRVSDWRTLNPIRARQAKLINQSLVEVPLNETETDRKICPSEITKGMLITQHGYIGKVVEVSRYDRSEERKKEPFVYVVRMTYVRGNLDMHKWFISNINNGCDTGYLSTQQGNRLSHFYQIIEE